MPTLVGYGQADITPRHPVRLAGYYFERISTGVHDPLFARSMAVSDGGETVVLCVADLPGVRDPVLSEARRLAQDQLRLPARNIIFSAVHSHTAPFVQQEPEYTAGLPAMMAESIRQAVANLAPAELKAARGSETTLQFTRRYRMKDGSVRTNPGIRNPDIVAPLGTPDPDLQVLIATQNGAPRVGIAHYALHCDTVGGAEISADWTHYLREGMRAQLGSRFDLLTPIGPCGDVNHWNVFRDVSLRGFAETERIGSALARAALQAVAQAQPIKPGPVRALQSAVELRARKPTAHELAEANEVLAKPPPTGVDFSMDRVEARRRKDAGELPDPLRLDLTVLAFGNVALIGLPAECFTGLGRSIKNRSPFDHTFVCTLSNGGIDYIAEKHNYDEGGYETTSSVIVPGGGELLADAAVALLRQAHARR